MTVTYLTDLVGKKVDVSNARKTRRNGKAPTMNLDQPGRLWLSNLMHLFGVSHQTIYNRIKSGEYPSEDGMDGKRRFWKTSTIRKFLESSTKSCLP